VGLEVDYPDSRALPGQRGDDVAADEARAAGDQDPTPSERAHDRSLLVSLGTDNSEVGGRVPLL
jgi:hypothetical protein